MFQIRKSEERGFANHGWLKSRFSFSFAEYHDPKHMGFRALRVINEDHIEGGTGFGSHPHRDMEIITYVIKGALEHQDSMGTKAVIRPGEVQRMSAGSGVVHSEFSPVPGQETHLLQIWIQPNTRGGAPGYEQKSFADDFQAKNLVLVASQEGRDGSLSIKQDADVYVSHLKTEEALQFNLRPSRGVWVQIVSGRLNINGAEFSVGDAVSFEDEEALSFKAKDQSEFILFDLT